MKLLMEKKPKEMKAKDVNLIFFLFLFGYLCSSYYIKYSLETIWKKAYFYKNILLIHFQLTSKDGPLAWTKF